MRDQRNTAREECGPRYDVILAAVIYVTIAGTLLQTPIAFAHDVTTDKPGSQTAAAMRDRAERGREGLPTEEEWRNRPDPFIPVILPETEKASSKTYADESTQEPAGASTESDLSAEDVTTQLDEAKEVRRGLIGEGILGSFAAQWYRFNDTIKEAVGLDLGIAYTALYQYATSDGVPNEGAAGDFDFFGSWHLVGQEGKNAGSLTFATEGRHAFTSYTPSEIGRGIGSLWGTADGFNTQEFSLTQLWWSQQLFQDHLRLRLGKLDQGTFIDKNRFKSASFFFLNQAFSSNPTLPLPASGFGIGGRFDVVNFVHVTFGYSNANAVKTRIDIDTLKEREFFSTVEVRYSPEIPNWGRGNYRLTAWHADERKKAGLPSGQGLSFSFDQELGNGVIPFLRYAFADGGVTATRQMLSGGLGIEGPFGMKDDLIGVGIAWGDPKIRTWRDQYVGEVFYRLQFSANSRLTPGYQLIIRPSNAPDDDTVSVFELRFRITF